MASPICNHECNSGNCPFMADPHDNDRQVCLKCGQEYSFHRRSAGNLLLAIALLLSILMITRNNPKTTEFPPKIPAIENRG